MAQRKLGRGLDALVTLSPAEADGTARIDEAVRESSRASVLSLSGRSVEDFFRVVPVEEVADVRVRERIVVAPAAHTDAGDGDVTEPGESGPMEASDDEARSVQYSLFDPEIEEAPAAVAEAPAAIVEAPAAIAPARAAVDAAPAGQTEAPTAEVEAPASGSEAPTTDLEVPATPELVVDPATDDVEVEDEVVFIDDAVGGLVFPDVELE